MIVKLAFDLMCEKTVPNAGYRVIVDNELMTERDYIWDNANEYVRENVPLQLEPGIHTLEIQNLDRANSTFHINNITINNKPYTLNGKEFIV